MCGNDFDFLIRFGLWLLVWLVPLPFIFYGSYFLLTLPLRRQERARFFLDVLERQVKRGLNVEQAIIAISQSRDLSFGARFYLLAAHLEEGFRLGQALDKVPRFLPPNISAMLKVGEEIGDVKCVLPVCRALLTDGRSRTRSAFNYLIILIFVVTPVLPVMFFILKVMIWPKYVEIFREYVGSTAIPAVSHFVFESSWFITGHFFVVLLIYLAAFLYTGGPHVFGWLKMLFGSLPDSVALQIPWWRKRIERNFSATLGLLLDANVPEAKAVQFAARGTANDAVMARAERVAARLAAGEKLSDALQIFDKTGEFRWRIQNAAYSPSGFRAALAGWIEALDAKAFQQEQTASQIITTALVILNGALVGLLVIAGFQPLIALINAAALW